MPLGVTVSPGGSENPLDGNELSQLVDELERAAEADRVVAVAQPHRDVGLLSVLRDEDSSSNHRMMKPNRLTLKLLSVAVASAVAGALDRAASASRRSSSDAWAASTVSARGTSRFALSALVTSRGPVESAPQRDRENRARASSARRRHLEVA